MKMLYIMCMIFLLLSTVKVLNKNKKSDTSKKDAVLIFSKLYENKQNNKMNIAKVNISSF